MQNKRLPFLTLVIGILIVAASNAGNWNVGVGGGYSSHGGGDGWNVGVGVGYSSYGGPAYGPPPPRPCPPRRPPIVVYERNWTPRPGVVYEQYPSRHYGPPTVIIREGYAPCGPAHLGPPRVTRVTYY